MAITFPLRPADGQLHNMGGIVYIYKLQDDKWVAQSSISSGSNTTPLVNDVYFGLVDFDANTGNILVARNDGFVANTNIDGRYVKRIGDTMTGLLNLSADPVLPLQAATKQYVDLAIAAGDVYTVTAALDSATGLLTNTRNDGNTYSVNLYSGLDARYVNVTGDTMTGPLTISSDLVVTGNTSLNNVTANGTSTFNGNVYTNSELFSNNVTIAGTTTANTLVVNGPSTFNSNVVMNQTLTANTVVANGPATFNSNVAINQTLTANTLTVNGPSTFNSNVVMNQTLVSNTIISNTINTTNLTASGNTILNGDVYTTSNLYSNNVTIAGTTTLQGNTVINGTLTAANVDITLASLTDVSVPTPANGQILTFNSTTSLWEAKSLPPATADTFLSNVTFDANTRVLTTQNSDGVTHSVTISDADKFVNAVAFDPITRVLTIVRNDGTSFTSTIPDADSFVNSVAFNAATRILSIVRNDGSTFTSFIPDADTNTSVNGLAFNSNTNVLTLTNSDASVLTANIVINPVMSLNSLTNVEATPANGQVLTFNSANATWIATSVASGQSIPSGVFSGQSLIWNGTAWTPVTPNAVAPWSYSSDAAANSAIAAVNGGTLPLGAYYYNTLIGQNRYYNNVTSSWSSVSTVAALNDLTNVEATPTNGQVLSFNAANSTWIATTLPAGTADTFTANAVVSASGLVTFTKNDLSFYTANLATHTSTLTLNSLANVESAPTNGQVLTFNSANSTWIASAIPAQALNDLTNVEATATNGQVLSFNAANSTWIATTLPAGTTDTFTANGVIDANGVITYTKNDLSTYAVDISSYVPTITLGGLSNVDGEADDIGSAAFLVRNTAGLWRAGGVELNQLSNVETAALPANGQVLTFNSANSTWIAATPASGGISFANTASTLNGVARYSSLTGQVVKDSTVTISDQGDLTALSVNTGAFKIDGSYNAKHSTLAAGFPTVNLDWKGTSYFKMTLASGNAPTINFVNVPLSTYVGSMTIEVLCNGGTLTWPASVKWPDGGTAPTLTTGKTYLFMLTTSNGGTTVLASSLTGYV